MLDDHLPSNHHDRHSRDLENGPSGCPTCRTDDDDLVEDVPHALFCCVAHAAQRASFLDSLREFVGASSFAAFMSLSPMCRSVALLRDDFMSSVANPTIVPSLIFAGCQKTSKGRLESKRRVFDVH